MGGLFCVILCNMVNSCFSGNLKRKCLHNRLFVYLVQKNKNEQTGAGIVQYSYTQ